MGPAEGKPGTPPLRIRLLGRFEVLVGDAIVLDRSWNRAKAKALLKLLALQQRRPVHREQVLDALWPDLDPGAGGANLRKNLHYLRSTLAARGFTDPVITSAADMLALSEAAIVDVDAFREAARDARAARDDLELYESALGLYAGDLLPEDIYEDWAGAPREELRGLRRDLLAAVAALYEGRGALELAVDRLQQLLQADPLDEEAHRSLMRLHAVGGSRHRALRQYERCRDVLGRELGVAPAPETEALHRQVLEGRVGHQVSPTLARVSPPAPMYGRERELDLASDVLESAAEGRGQVLFVSGAAGIGKTRFIQELLAAALDQGSLVLTGRSYELEASVAYQPVREVLLQIDGAGDKAVRQAVHGSLYLKRLLPHARLDASPVADASVLQSELFEEAARLFRTVSMLRPLVVCLEDIHAADQASLQLLHFLGRQLASQRILLLATYRTDEAAREGRVTELVASLAREGVAQALELPPLPDGVMHLVIAHALGGSPAEGSLRRELTRLAEGNPLFAHEMAHTLREERWARLVDGRWERRGLDPAPLPVAIREMVDRRLRRLGEAGREVVAVGSVLGREFTYHLLRGVVALPEPAVLDALDDAIGAYLLEETAEGYRFRHDLVREAVYRGLTRARRQQLHRHIGTVMAETPAGEVDAEQVGYHFARSDEAWRAVPHLQAAARKAASVFANHQALERYEEALALARGGPVERAQLATLLEELGDLKCRVGDVRGSVALSREALSLFAEIGDGESDLRVRGKAGLGLVMLGEGEQAASLLGGYLEEWRQLIGQQLGQRYSSLGISAAFYVLAQLRWHRGQHREAWEAAERAAIAAEASGDVRRRARAYESLALACHALGDWEKGVSYELRREALGLAGFETDVALDGHL
jgi:DNA-binding SARP family transcriptional activator